MGDKIAYKFGLDEMVTTPLNEKGVVTMLGFDGGGQQYYVETRSNSHWFKEKSLKEYADVDSGTLGYGAEFYDDVSAYLGSCCDLKRLDSFTSSKRLYESFLSWGEEHLGRSLARLGIKQFAASADLLIPSGKFKKNGVLGYGVAISEDSVSCTHCGGASVYLDREQFVDIYKDSHPKENIFRCLCCRKDFGMKG